MNGATVICQKIFSILTLVIFFLEVLLQKMFQNHLFSLWRRDPVLSYNFLCRLHCSSCVKVVFCFGCVRNTSSFAAGSRKSYWSGCMKAATMVCQQIFSILALVIFQGKQIWLFGKICVFLANFALFGNLR